MGAFFFFKSITFYAAIQNDWFSFNNEPKWCGNVVVFKISLHFNFSERISFTQGESPLRRKFFLSLFDHFWRIHNLLDATILFLIFKEKTHTHSRSDKWKQPQCEAAHFGPGLHLIWFIWSSINTSEKTELRDTHTEDKGKKAKESESENERERESEEDRDGDSWEKKKEKNKGRNSLSKRLSETDHLFFFNFFR